MRIYLRLVPPNPIGMAFLNTVFSKFKSYVKEIVSPVFTFEMKKGALYQKEDLVDLTVNTGLMNCYAEGFAKALRENKHSPTSETLLDYLKLQTVDDILETAKVQIDRCTVTLKKKGIRLNKAALAFEMHYAKRFNYNTQRIWVDVVEAVDSKGVEYFLGTNLP